MLETARSIRERLLHALEETELRGDKIVPKTTILLSRHEALIMVMIIEHLALTNAVLKTASEFIRLSRNKPSIITGRAPSQDTI